VVENRYVHLICGQGKQGGLFNNAVNDKDCIALRGGLIVE
jgi:hypothetical protein